MAAAYTCNRIPQLALNMKTPYEKLYGKDPTSRISSHRRKGLRTKQKPNKIGHAPWEGMVCGFSETESNSHRIWNSNTRRVVESRNVVFIETPPNLLPATRRLSPQQNFESLSYDFSRDALDDNYVSYDNMLRDGAELHLLSEIRRRHACGTVELLLPQQVSPDVTSPGGASPAGSLPRELHRRDHHLQHCLHLLLRHQGQLTDTTIVVWWESRPPLRAAKPHTFGLCLSLHVTREAATTTEQL